VEPQPVARHPSAVWSVAFDPSGRTLASADFGGTIRVSELPGGREVASLAGHRMVVSGLDITPDGRTLASVSYDGAVKLWHLPTGRELFDLPAGGGPLGHVRFSPDGRALYVTDMAFPEASGRVTWRYDAPR
jgi:WD40 repeat protein